MNKYVEAIKQLKTLISHDKNKLKNIYSYIRSNKNKNYISSIREIVRVKIDNIVFRLTEDDIISIFFTDYRRIDDIYYIHLSDLFLNLKTGRVHTSDKAIDQKFDINIFRNKFFKLIIKSLINEYKENKKSFKRIGMVTSINSYLVRNNIKFIFRDFDNKIKVFGMNSQFIILEGYKNIYGILYNLTKIEKQKLDKNTSSLLFISENNKMLDKTYESLDYDQYDHIIDIIGDENINFNSNIIYNRKDDDE